MQDHTNTAIVLVLGISDWCKTYHHDNLEACSCDKELKQELGNKVTNTVLLIHLGTTVECRLSKRQLSE